jgi:hypothetical protein
MTVGSNLAMLKAVVPVSTLLKILWIMLGLVLPRELNSLFYKVRVRLHTVRKTYDNFAEHLLLSFRIIITISYKQTTRHLILHKVIFK